MMTSNSEIKTIIVCEDEIYPSSTSSKGNQIKYTKDDVWIKQDLFGYEGMAECVASQIANMLEISHIGYDPCLIYIIDTGKTQRGCYSKNFISEGLTELTLQRLVQRCTGQTCDELLENYHTTKDKLFKLAETLSAFIDADTFIEYICQILIFDSIILNTDRHWNNILLLMNSAGNVQLAPVFDNGDSFFSDIRMGFPLDVMPDYDLWSIMAKPFAVPFREQVTMAKELLRNPLPSIKFSVPDYSKLIQIYEKDYIKQVKAVLRNTTHMIDV